MDRAKVNVEETRSNFVTIGYTFDFRFAIALDSRSCLFYKCKNSKNFKTSLNIWELPKLVLNFFSDDTAA